MRYKLNIIKIKWNYEELFKNQCIHVSQNIKVIKIHFTECLKQILDNLRYYVKTNIKLTNRSHLVRLVVTFKINDSHWSGKKA